ncbi:hypothetical protein FA15DRAFT_758799 [Coprinopsis marcescibilis]|uniref:Uncharacterized protein n=1 Tax=Coprinopsis marcescibilis TaxID=230819 RepID=A0A5C3KLR1_COPMA|nr:hypothetical protein FA15DRAFT_758799 [Coprinopsis marcescibilis]
MARGFRALGLALFVLFQHIGFSAGAIVNRTIDDTAGDEVTGIAPVFLPPGMWNPPDCPHCDIRPNASLSFNGTYLETTYLPAPESEVGPVSFTFNFEGTALYLFFILVNGLDGITYTEFDVKINGGDAGKFVHSPDPTSQDRFAYQQLTYNITGLPQVNHTVEVITQGELRAYVNFDYAIYTLDDALPPSNTTGSPVVGPRPTGPEQTTAAPSPNASPSNQANSPTTTRGSSALTSMNAMYGSIVGGLTALLVALLA